MTIRNIGLRLLLICSCLPANSPADELGDAVRAAVRMAAPSVVRLRVIGGELAIDGDKVSSLVTTGLVISSEGEILTSQFALQGNPESILIEGNGGQRSPARIVATDHVRKIVLLKATGGEWTPAEFARPESVSVGQWAIALGRFFSPEQTSLSTGVISALNRIHGMALQTDAKVSPVNYGGPLINLQGQVLGILVPLSPRGQATAAAGIEWYDSGIGFAIPGASCVEVAGKLRSGQDLLPGRLGLRLSTPGVFSSRITVEQVIRNGPAAKAGLLKGDLLVAANGISLDRVAVLEEMAASRYSGDQIVFQIRRSHESLTLPVTLEAELPKSVPAYLGLMSVRARPVDKVANQEVSPPAKAAPTDGKEPNSDRHEPGLSPPAEKLPQNPDPPSGPVPLVVVNGGPAASSGMPSVILLETINGQTVDSAAQVESLVAERLPGENIQLSWKQEGRGEVHQSEIPGGRPVENLVELSGSVLEAVHHLAIAEPGIDFIPKPQGEESPRQSAETDDAVKREEVDFEDRGRCLVFTATKPHAVLPGVVLLLWGNRMSEEQLLRNWKPFIRSHCFTLIAPLNPEKSDLTAEDAPLIMTSLQAVAAGRKADLRRVVVVGDQVDSRLAWQLISSNSSPIHAVAMKAGWLLPTDVEGSDGSGKSVLYLDPENDVRSRSLLSASSDELIKSGFRVSRANSQSPERTIADWSLLLRAF